MSINRFFQDTLGANLKNPRWSWGAIDPVSNRVFLRVWDDEIQPDGDGERVQIYWKNSTRNSPGFAERREHLEVVRNGAEGIGVVCRARDPQTTEARQIADFQKSSLLQLGDFTEDDKGIYAHIAARIPISELARARTAHSTLTKDLRAIISTKTGSTSKEALVDARVGQGAFRSAVRPVPIRSVLSGGVATRCRAQGIAYGTRPEALASHRTKGRVTSMHLRDPQ